MADAPDYVALAKQQAEIDKKAMLTQNFANRPTQLGTFGTLDYAYDPTTERWVQKESLDPRVQGLVDKSLGLQGQQMSKLAELQGRADFKTAPGASLYKQADPGIAAYDPKSGDAYSKLFTQNLLARVAPQQQIDRSQMETKLRLQGLQPGSEAYNRAYQNLLTSQGDVNAKAQLEGMLAGGQESRDIYNTRLGSAMQLAENARAGYQTTMQGQNQMNAQAMQQYLAPYQVQEMNQSLQQGAWQPYMPSFQGFGVAQGSSGMDLVGAAQSQYAAQAQADAAKAAKKAGTGAMIGGLIGGAAGLYFSGGNPAVGKAGYEIGSGVGSSWSDADLKSHIEPIDDETAYYCMQRIQPYSFSWPSGSRDAGLVAQEVQKVFPHLVHEAEGGYLKVNYEAFSALLLGAFRHLAKKEQEHA